jgi:hypothetical protein
MRVSWLGRVRLPTRARLELPVLRGAGCGCGEEVAEVYANLLRMGVVAVRAFPLN